MAVQAAIDAEINAQSACLPETAACAAVTVEEAHCRLACVEPTSSAIGTLSKG
jgi:hypothetical protein